ncbi:MAG: HesA/MoeB/ThiF family protein [Candidatus Binataceae bacterium]
MSHPDEGFAFFGPPLKDIVASHAMSDTRNRPVLIVGVGGLGVPAALALVRGGIAELALIDPDPVELSNLPRQVIYGEDDCDALKVAAAARRIREIAPAIRLTTYASALASTNGAELIARSAFVIDATDDPATKFLINDLCVASSTPFVYGGVVGMTGQAMTVIPRRTACLRCLFEEPPDEDEVASCREAGIIGPVAGAIGEAQATDALRWLRGVTPALAGTMLTYDGKLGRVRLTEIAARSGCVCGAAADAAAASLSVRTS